MAACASLDPVRWYAVLFYLWLLVSVVILVRRRLGRAADRAEHLDDAPPPPPDRSLAERPWPRPDEAAAPAVPHVARPATSDAPLPRLLEGIHLPADLAPLTHLGPAPPGDRLVLVTRSAPPEVVASALADELERLGYAVASLTDTVAVARGERGAVEVEVHADAATAELDGARRFPTADDDAVVVELRPV